MRARLVRAFDQFHDIRHMNDGAAATLLRDLEIDIAVDLKGAHKGRAARNSPLPPLPDPGGKLSRLSGNDAVAIFTTTSSADEIVLPKDEQRLLFRKNRPPAGAHCYQVNCSVQQSVAPSATRGDYGLPDNGFVFCCFNNNWKITPASCSTSGCVFTGSGA